MGGGGGGEYSKPFGCIFQDLGFVMILDCILEYVLFRKRKKKIMSITL